MAPQPADHRGEGSTGLPDPFEWVGNALPADYANTASWPPEGPIEERLTDYSRLVDWALRSGILSVAEANPMLREAAAHPARAAATLDRARSLRAVVHQALASLARGNAPPASALGALNGFLPDALGHLAVDSTGDGCGCSWTWRHDGVDLDRMLWPIVWSTLGLLTSDQSRLVRQCGNQRCGWTFVDTSRNRTRKWCTMRDCGNRAKARRHYERRKRSTRGTGSAS